jgi:hypothetical protein
MSPSLPAATIQVDAVAWNAPAHRFASCVISVLLGVLNPPAHRQQHGHHRMPGGVKLARPSPLPAALSRPMVGTGTDRKDSRCAFCCQRPCCSASPPATASDPWVLLAGRRSRAEMPALLRTTNVMNDERTEQDSKAAQSSCESMKATKKPMTAISPVSSCTCSVASGTIVSTTIAKMAPPASDMMTATS